MTRHLPHAFLVAEAITDLEQHRQDLEGFGRHERESSTGWCRDLWIQSLGIPAVLPPPEEEKDVKTDIGTAPGEEGR